MKVPCRWLAEYVELEVSEREVLALAERLTLSGLEVEGITRVPRPQGAVVGRVLEHRPHPDSDHLSLCRVDLGDRETEIVCGAQNVVDGAAVPVVVAGGVLPGGFKITRRKVRGVVSDGMICSKAELGLEEKSPGIWNFDPEFDFPPGTDLNEILEYDDFVLDIKVTSNRPDCLGIYGIAREVAAVTGKTLRPIELSFTESDPPAGEFFSVVIEDPADTPRYTARLMSGVRIGPAPLVMQHRLIKAGMRPLSNVVDVTNYVMLELGHPLHPFDADLLGEEIRVRRAKRGESFRTLDGIERPLSDEVLMIADNRDGLAIAGVMGGERSEISDGTTRVLLEAAAFDPVTIRRSARAVGLRTEAAQRFERGVDPEGVPRAASRAVHLLQKLTGCTVHKGLIDAYPAPRRPWTVRLRPARAEAVLGIEVDKDWIKAVLDKLEIGVEEDGDTLIATIPTFRTDLTREADLIEEIGRIYGYDRFPSVPPRAVLRMGRKNPLEAYKDRAREILTGLGVNEAVTDGFAKLDWRAALGLPDDGLVRPRNPMAADQKALRDRLIPGLLAVVRTNLNRGVVGGMIFETGRVFSEDGERDALSAAFFGRTGIPLRGKEEVDLLQAKGILMDLLAGLGVDGARIEPADPPPFFHPGRGGRVLVGKDEVGVFGELSPAIAADRLDGVRVILFELDLEGLFARRVEEKTFTPLPRYPASKRDLSLLVPEGLPEEEVRAAIAAEKRVEGVLLYDLYQGDQVAPGYKSLTYELTLRAPDRTLTDEEVAKAISRIERRLAQLGVKLRA